MSIPGPIFKRTYQFANGKEVVLWGVVKCSVLHEEDLPYNNFLDHVPRAIPAPIKKRHFVHHKFGSCYINDFVSYVDVL